MDDHPHRQPQVLVDLAHPLRVALGQVVVHRHHVNPVPRQRVQIAGQRRHQRLALAGLHLADLALVQHHAADQLHVEVPHLHRAPPRLAHHGERLGQYLVQRLPLRRGLLNRPPLGNLPLFSLPLGRLQLGGALKPLQPLLNPLRNPRPELHGLRPQLLGRHLLYSRLQSVDRSHHRPHPFHDPFVRRSKNLGKNLIEKHRYLRLPV